MTRTRVRAGLVLGLVALGLVAAVATAAARTTAAKPIVIGWAYDGKGSMAPFDDPALAKYFRCILTGMFAQTYYRFEDGPAERYKLLNRLIEDQDHYDTACRLRLADELLAELRGPIAA